MILYGKAERSAALGRVKGGERPDRLSEGGESCGQRRLQTGRARGEVSNGIEYLEADHPANGVRPSGWTEWAI